MKAVSAPPLLPRLPSKSHDRGSSPPCIRPVTAPVSQRANATRGHQTAWYNQSQLLLQLCSGQVRGAEENGAKERKDGGPGGAMEEGGDAGKTIAE